MNTLQQFLHPPTAYRNQNTPENRLFNANLQEFAHHVTMISNLESNGKLSPAEAYQQIETLWQNFEAIVEEVYPYR